MAAGVTYFIVVPFRRDHNGMIVPGEAKEVANGEQAKGQARTTSRAAGNIGAVALSRTGDPQVGAFEKGTMLAGFGEFDLDALYA